MATKKLENMALPELRAMLKKLTGRDSRTTSKATLMSAIKDAEAKKRNEARDGRRNRIVATAHVRAREGATTTEPNEDADLEEETTPAGSEVAEESADDTEDVATVELAAPMISVNDDAPEDLPGAAAADDDEEPMGPEAGTAAADDEDEPGTREAEPMGALADTPTATDGADADERGVNEDADEEEPDTGDHGDDGVAAPAADDARIEATQRTPSNRGRFLTMTVEELQTLYVQTVGRPTGSVDRGYLTWKIREAEKGRITVGPDRAKARAGTHVAASTYPDTSTSDLQAVYTTKTGMATDSVDRAFLIAAITPGKNARRAAERRFAATTIGELQARYTTATGLAIDSLDREFLMAAIIASETRSPAPPFADAAISDLQVLYTIKTGEAADDLDRERLVAALAPSEKASRAIARRFIDTTNAALQTLFTATTGLVTDSLDREFLIAAITTCEKRRTGDRTVDPSRYGSDRDKPVLPLRVSREAANAMDEVWQQHSYPSRLAFLRAAIGDLLRKLGADDAAAMFNF